MISYDALKKVDSENMHEIYDKWPEIAFESYHNAGELIKYPKTSHFVFAGMGGSGAMSDIFSAILSKTETHVTIVKGHHLPRTVNSDSIVIISSVSGNTSETISVLRKAIEIGAKTIAFSDGGEIKKICEENNIPHRNIKKYHSPRGSFTAFLYSMLAILKPILPIKESDVLESIESLKFIGIKINSDNISTSNPALKIAEWIEHTPVIYFPGGLQSAAIRFKNSLQENCKIHVIAEDVIEACHNGIVSWEKSRNFQPILIRGTDDFEKTVQLWNTIKQFFDSKQINYKEIVSEKGNILTKLISMIYLLDYASIYLSVKLGIDPTPVEAIDFIKKACK
jgi:glucose/mannose-6-phosphate isomerase